MYSSVESGSFDALSDVARSLRALKRDVSRLRQAARTAAGDMRAIAAWSKDLPRLELNPSDTAAGDDVLRGLCSHQPWPFRYRAVAVIELPSSFESYLRGRSRQAVRTNRRRALNLGLRAAPAASTLAALRQLDVMLRHHAFYPTIDDLLRRHVESGQAQIWFVTTAAGTPVAMAAVTVDRGTAQLATLQVALDVADRSATRYLLSTEIISSLIDQSVSHLLADSMLFSSPGVVYLQQRLGFEPMNIDVPRQRRRRSTTRDDAGSAAGSAAGEPEDAPEPGAVNGIGYREPDMTRVLLLPGRGEAR